MKKINYFVAVFVTAIVVAVMVVACNKEKEKEGIPSNAFICKGSCTGTCTMHDNSQRDRSIMYEIRAFNHKST